MVECWPPMGGRGLKQGTDYKIYQGSASPPMLGFLGTFSVNFEIPDYWGIGKSVSRGFGTVKRLKDI